MSFGLVSLLFEELGHDIAPMLLKSFEPILDFDVTHIHGTVLASAGWKDQMESAWSTSWKQSMFHAFTPGQHLWILAGCLDVNRVRSILVCVYIVCFRVTLD